MSNFSTNFQFNIAQLNNIAKEQEKIISVSKKQQNKVSQKIDSDRDISHNSVTATEERNNTNRIKDDEEQEPEKQKEQKQLSANKKEHNTKEKQIIYKDEDKGKVVDFTC